MFIEVQVYAQRRSREADAARATAAVEAWVAKQGGRIETLLQEEIEAGGGVVGEGFSQEWADAYDQMHAIAFAAATEGWANLVGAEIYVNVKE